MKASKTLGRPENWQDFESLCKRLWGEIWECSEIKKNGRAGQNQNGVDVYGIPSFDEEYYGIQCKGKDQYTHKQLTTKEIEKEIKKAKTFEPKLKKLYFATTAVKDAEIEKFIRLKNIEHKKLSLFEVHLFSWEDIVDLIEENPDTYNYYFNSINFKTSNSVAITFGDNTTEITITPKYKKRITNFRQKIVTQNTIVGSSIFDLIQQQQTQIAHVISISQSRTKINYSFCPLYLSIHNTGTTPLEEYKILLDFEGDIVELSDKNEETTGYPIINFSSKIYTTFLNSENMTGRIIPRKNILVGDDTFSSDVIFIKPSPDESKITIKWKLISKYYKANGDLLINVVPVIETVYKDVLVEDPFKVRIEESDIEDFIFEKEIT